MSPNSKNNKNGGSMWSRLFPLNMTSKSIFPKSDKDIDYEVGINEALETPLKNGITPQFVITHQNLKKSEKAKKASKMVTISGPRSLQTLRLFFSEITVEPILFLYMLSTFAQYSSFQDLVYSRACLQSYSSDICDNLHSPELSQEAENVQSMASHLILLSTTALVLPSIFIAVYLGSWSDRFGRKWPIVFPPLGGVLACVVYMVLAFQPHLPIQWIFLASFLSGLFGGFVSCIMSCMSYVSSASSEENRTVRISRLEAMIFLGGTVGPFLSGSLLQYIGHGFSFVFMLGCYAVAFFYALFCVKEIQDGDHLKSDETINQHRPQSAASSVISSSLKSSTLDSHSRQADLDLESAEHLLSHSPNNLPDVAITTTDAVFIDTEHIIMHYDPFQTPSPYQPLSSSGHSHFEDASSTAASEDEQRNILRRSRNSTELENTENVSCCSRYFGSEHFFGALKSVVKRREGGRRKLLILSLIAGYIGMMITAGELDVAYLFAKGEPLKWSHKTFSYYFGFKYGLGTLVLLIGMPLCQRFQLNDSTVCIIGLLSRMVGLILYALSPNTNVAFLVPVVAIFSFFSIPATRSLLSKLVNPTEQGKIFAFVAIMEDLCTMSASMVFNSLYPLTRPIHKGFIFLLAAALLIVPILTMWFIGHQLTRLERLESQTANIEHCSTNKGKKSPAHLESNVENSSHL